MLLNPTRLRAARSPARVSLLKFLACIINTLGNMDKKHWLLWLDEPDQTCMLCIGQFLNLTPHYIQFYKDFFLVSLHFINRNRIKYYHDGCLKYKYYSHYEYGMLCLYITSLPAVFYTFTFPIKAQLHTGWHNSMDLLDISLYKTIVYYLSDFTLLTPCSTQFLPWHKHFSDISSVSIQHRFLAFPPPVVLK